ncbi:hypothetical protein YC2023_069320 [Brassica napus]
MNPISSRLTSASLLPIPHTISLISAMAFSSSSSSSVSLKVPTFKEEEEKLRQVLKYHNQTKHSFTNYARGPRGLDWANQPNPFRRYLSSPLLPLLQHSSDHDSVLYSSLFDSSLPPPKPISLSTISHLFLHSLALSAWKTTGASTWPLRVNPSSGNLHPTEAYLISPPIPSLSHLPFVAHYAPKEHSLEVRANLPSSFFPKFFPENSFLIGVSSIFWREAWKYGERAFRYYKSAFYQMLMHSLPSGSSTKGEQLALPFRALSWDCAEVHLALFVHRVSGFPKGLYFLVRNEDHLGDLKRAMRSEFEWRRPDGCPEDLPLYMLAEGDCQRLAKGLSCHQDIAGDGCFSLGMVARFEPVMREMGSWMYPRLFWETGVVGQVLYLEAHAMGISATGIGCYFDDPVHEVLGIKDSSFQSLYHFTVGGPVLDKRIMTLPAYPGPTSDV